MHESSPARSTAAAPLVADAPAVGVSRARSRLAAPLAVGLACLALGCGASPTGAAPGPAGRDATIAALMPAVSDWYLVAWGQALPADVRARHEGELRCLWDAVAARDLDPAPDFACYGRLVAAGTACMREGAVARLRECVEPRLGCHYSAAFLEAKPVCAPAGPEPSVLEPR